MSEKLHQVIFFVIGDPIDKISCQDGIKTPVTKINILSVQKPSYKIRTSAHLLPIYSEIYLCKFVNYMRCFEWWSCSVCLRMQGFAWWGCSVCLRMPCFARCCCSVYLRMWYFAWQICSICLRMQCFPWWGFSVCLRPKVTYSWTWPYIKLEFSSLSSHCRHALQQ